MTAESEGSPQCADCKASFVPWFNRYGPSKRCTPCCKARRQPKPVCKKCGADTVGKIRVCDPCKHQYEMIRGRARKLRETATRRERICLDCSKSFIRCTQSRAVRCDACLPAYMLRAGQTEGRRIGRLLRRALAQNGRSPWAEQHLGYTIQQLRDHLERHFTGGMTWEAFLKGDIHIDHIIPLSAFDSSTAEGARTAWALTNLQPLWGQDNISKGARLDWSPTQTGACQPLMKAA